MIEPRNNKGMETNHSNKPDEVSCRALSLKYIQTKMRYNTKIMTKTDRPYDSIFFAPTYLNSLFVGFLL